MNLHSHRYFPIALVGYAVQLNCICVLKDRAPVVIATGKHLSIAPYGDADAGCSHKAACSHALDAHGRVCQLTTGRALGLGGSEVGVRLVNPLI